VKNFIHRIYIGRALGNACGRKWHNREQVLEAEVHAERARYAAAAAGDFNTAVVYTGEAIDMIHSIEPTEAILHRVVAGAEAALARRFD
jgi:nitronate monooxygenase